MNRHQVLTGACNSGDQCYAAGSVEGIHFLAYAAGCDIVILASDFQRVQIIPGVTHGNIKVSCIDCSTDTGKIAASYHSTVYIFEPTPLLHHESSHKLDYHWYQTATFEAECFINCLSWNTEGGKILTGGEVIQIWCMGRDPPDDDEADHGVRFQLGGHDHDHDAESNGNQPCPQQQQQQQQHQEIQFDDSVYWDCTWRCRPATPVYHLKFSPDGMLFASASRADRLVKIWYEDRKIQFPLARADSSFSPKKEELHYSFVYIAHPRAITGFSWRKTSKYMPRGSVANMLVTSCRDNVCRLWCETILPDDGLVDLEQIDPNAALDSKFQTERHKKRFMQRLKTIRHAIHKRKKSMKQVNEMLTSFPYMNSDASVHDFHKFAIHQNRMSPALHFHLAASINPETDIPLLPVVGSKGDFQYNFQLHWLNNKELQFTMEAEGILQEMHRRTAFDDDSTSQDTGEGDALAENDEEVDGDRTHLDLREGETKKRQIYHRRGKRSKKRSGQTDGDSQSCSSSDDDDRMSVGSSASPEGSIIDALDRKIENLLRDWHSCSDMLFSIHPVDGSYLIWLVDWLDEYTPYCFRQAQVSFSSRLPHAFPIPDARTMASNLLMYCNYSKMDIKSAMKLSESKYSVDPRTAPASDKSSPGQVNNMLIPNVLLVSKHINGSLNQWQISFSETSKFSTVVSIAHVSRACGHRFRTNSASCHPVLPLLLTTSHHNIPESTTPDQQLADGCLSNSSHGDDNDGDSEETVPKDGNGNQLVGGFEFCSELILWRVDPVGPLSKSGGIVELARINSPQISAFSSVAWVPTLLPSSTLGTYCNSPSALFIASDGSSLRMYQAVIDARTLLIEMAPQRNKSMSFSSNTSSGYSVEVSHPPSEVFNIVSLQSSARPGCIIDLEAITDAKQNWQQTQLLHVFQEQMVSGKSSTLGEHVGAVVDLRHLGSFEENFYLVVLEKNERGWGSTLHMWKITISSQPGAQSEDCSDNSQQYMTDFHVLEEEELSPHAMDTGIPNPRPTSIVKLSISTTKVCTQTLPLPEGVDVVSANVAAGHLSSSSIYPACLAPYLLTTACSDGETRFWRCSLTKTEPGDSGYRGGADRMSISTNFELAVREEDGVRKPSLVTSTKSLLQDTQYDWDEWQMMSKSDNSSAVSVPGKPITVSCAYSGRMSVAYRLGAIKEVSDHPSNKFVNLCVAVYECESTGGSEWMLEDTIELKNINIPDPKAEIDMAQIYSPTSDTNILQASSALDTPRPISPSSSLLNLSRTKSVPSLSTIVSVRKCISEQGNKTGILTQKHLVQLDWVSTEDGSHILTVGIGSRILMYAQVSGEMVQASQKSFLEARKGEKSVSDTKLRRLMLQKSKSMVVGDYQDEIKWMKLRTIDLTTADGLLPLPMHISWVRSGILVVGMDNEMHVYSQWKNSSGSVDVSPDTHSEMDKRNIDKVNLTNQNSPLANLLAVKTASSFHPSNSIQNLKKSLSSFRKDRKSSSLANTKKSSLSESTTSLSVIQECGLFEAAHQANPSLPQYHPKNLMELLNFGKIRRVKAILAHLVRCIAGSEASQTVYVEDHDNEDAKRNTLRHRTMSIAGSPGEMPKLQEEPILGYDEVNAIPPLPIYALLAMDNDNATIQEVVSSPTATTSNQPDYSNLFTQDVLQDDVLDTNVLGSSSDSKAGWGRMPSASQPIMNPGYFGPHQSRLLTKHLTHIHLPGLSSLDQMYLLALADTVANTKTEFSDKFEPEVSQLGGISNDTLTSGSQVADSVDDCGLRFLLAMRHHVYLLRILQPRQRILLQRQGLKTFNIVWALHSESTEELLASIPSVQKGEPTWEELKQFGAGWWISNINILKRCMEKVAKAAFTINKNPMDAALFYLAMKKKNVLWGLYRSIDDKKMVEFFRNDFSQERWRKAALKNAFALLGKQRFMHAAAFFLLSGSLNDAVEVCLDKLNDFQLALVVCRLYHGEDMMPESVTKLFYSHILGCDEDGDNYDSSRAHPDPFLRSMALWMLKKHKLALATLLQSQIGRARQFEELSELDSCSVTPCVFNFYNYLRTHPLILRQRLVTAAPHFCRKSIIPGFTRQQNVTSTDNNVALVDRVTIMERRLFFSTAHTHFKNGCPSLGLEVLSKLPQTVDDEDMSLLSPSFVNRVSHEMGNACIKTGTILETTEIKSEPNNFDWSQPVSSNSKLLNSTAGEDWSKPVTNGYNTADGFDWGTPISTRTNQSEELDWSQPISRLPKDELDLNFSIGSDSSESDTEKIGNETKETAKTNGAKTPNIVVDNIRRSSHVGSHQNVDIFAQQYKFIACLRVLMEEMQTLATGFEVDGGQLRFQLYIWLEKEVEALKLLCNYGNVEEEVEVEQPKLNEAEEDETEVEDSLTAPRLSRAASSKSDLSKPTLHEVILAEKMNFEAKLERMGRRKQWLKNHQQLLRTLVSYCQLQGARGGGLASVQMELLILLQELQQEKPQQQLLTPLPFPTTLPLLSASIASSKTVIADPIQHIQCMAQDLLHSLIEFVSPPGVGCPLTTVMVMRNLGIALSACIYQCLCDCDSFVVSLNESLDVGLEGFTSHNFISQASYLMSGVQRKRHRSVTEEIINTPPAKWPGVTSLRVLLAREKDENAPKLNILLCESLIAVYVSLLVNALAAYDCHMLYRLVNHKFDQQMWASLFGGGVKTIVKIGNNPIPPTKSADEVAKQRMKLHMKVTGYGTPAKEHKQTYKERFVPPELSMLTYLMTKPFISTSKDVFSYDSEESLSSDEEDAFDEEEETIRPNTLPISTVQQHTDPNSYSWCLLRYAVMKLVVHGLHTFLPQVGIELPELPVCSPLMHAVLKTLEQWESMLLGKLQLFAGPPDDYIAGLVLDVITGQPQSKYTAICHPSNSPFINNNSSLPIKRLWFHLVRQDYLKDVFLRYIFRKKKIHHEEIEDSSQNWDGPDAKLLDVMKIIHKEQDIITAFAINKATYLEANTNCVSLATQKEIVELDMGSLLNPPNWLEDENEFDIECVLHPSPANVGEGVDFLVVQTPADSQFIHQSGLNSVTMSPVSSPATSSSTPTGFPGAGLSYTQTGRGSSVILRRQVPGVRRIGSHPSLPHYLSGCGDGSVRLWEWGHGHPLAVLRQPGAFPKVTKVLFNAQGNKCCVSDAEGHICLWQVGMASNFNKPIMSLNCHNKTTSDFTFVGSSSLIATAGHSSESRNVCLWDTLLPPRSSCIHAFTCHEHGSPAIVFAPQHQLLISGGRKGEICIFDIRQRQMRHTFQAHDAPVRCLTIDPEEDYFVTGSAEGDIKVWGLDIHQLIGSYQGEHSKNTFFRNMGTAAGVTQVTVGPNHHLFSCGVDGSMKLRQLCDRDSIVRYWTQ